MAFTCVGDVDGLTEAAFDAQGPVDDSDDVHDKLDKGKEALLPYMSDVLGRLMG